jgi:hypothetical protein
VGIFRQVVNLLKGQGFSFRGAVIRNVTGKRVRLEIEMEQHEIRKTEADALSTGDAEQVSVDAPKAEDDRRDA